MPSTYSPDLRIELIANGEKTGTWGTITNDNLGTVIEDAISGLASVSVTSANQALTAQNGAADQARCAAVRLTTTTGASFNVYVPPVTKLYVISNASGQTATVYCSTVLGNTTAAGAGVAVPTGKTVLLRADSINIVEQLNHITGALSIGGALSVGGVLSLTTDLAIADGGTGASNASDARTNLGLGTMATQAASAVSITGGSITGITDLAVADGGTGASNASDARTNLGLGTIATQAASNVTITGGSITGITDLAIADGGTGASNASDARTNLGLGTIATQAANNVAITGGSVTGITDITIADGGTGSSTASGARTNLGLGTIATQNSNAVAITGGSVTGITDITIADGGTGASTAADARTNLGLGTMATQAASAVAITGGTIANVAITGGSVTGITDITIADGGTGASNASDARTNLGLGTMATQAASAVSITGGSIADITTLSVTTTATAPTPAAADNTTKIATTAFVTTAVGAADYINDPNANGIMARTGDKTATVRTITAGSGVSVTNGDGVSGNPTIANTGVLSVNSATGVVTTSQLGSGTADATTFLTGAATWVGVLGIGQTWQNVLSLRNDDVWYQNTTARPIFIAVRTGAGSSTLYFNTVASDTGRITIGGSDGASGTNDSFYSVIPVGGFYKSAGENPNIWAELR